MGYLTDYTFCIEEPDENVKAIDIVNAILKMQKENPNIFYLFEWDLSRVLTNPNFANMTNLHMAARKCKWYYHDEDMLELSRLFPNIIFKLHGRGEEYYDIWNSYYKNGKVKTYEAKVEMPSFNEKDLE